MEYYSAIKKNTFESVLMRWMKLEPITQSEVSQKEKHQYSILTHIYEYLQDLLELTPKKDVLFIIGDWNVKVGSQDAWNNRQIWLWSTEWSTTKANRVLPRECTGHSKHPLPTTQEKTLHMDITRWSTLKSDWFYSLQPKMEKLYTVSKDKTGSWLWLISWAAWFGSLLPNSDLNWRK